MLYSVFLWKVIAALLKMTAAELQEFGIIDKVISESEPADVDHTETLAAGMRAEIQKFLNIYEAKSEEELLEQRYAKFRKMGTEMLKENEEV